MAAKSTTTYTFAVTFEAPQGMNIPTARELIRDAMDEVLAGQSDLTKLKIHLTNKETSYGKR